MVKVDEINMDCYLRGIIPLQVKTLIDQPKGFPIDHIQWCNRNQIQLIDDFLHFHFAESGIGITVSQVCRQIIQKQDIFILSRKRFTVDIGIALLHKQLNNRLFQLILGELSFYKLVALIPTPKDYFFMLLI